MFHAGNGEEGRANEGATFCARWRADDSIGDRRARQYKPKLLALCKKAPTVTGYVIQVKGYASAVGSAALNQKLSQERAANVTEFLEQQGGIPLTNILAPGAMGTSRQVAPDNTAEGQAENRRVVVRILQNKGIAGT